MRPVYAEAAEALGVELVRRNIGVVYGGGSVGLMGKVRGQFLPSDRCHTFLHIAPPTAPPECAALMDQSDAK